MSSLYFLNHSGQKLTKSLILELNSLSKKVRDKNFFGKMKMRHFEGFFKHSNREGNPGRVAYD